MTAGRVDPQAYIQRERDGSGRGLCAAVNLWFSFYKNSKRLQTDSVYQQDWNDGFNVCTSQYESAA